MFSTIEPFRLERYFAQYEFHVQHMLCGSDAESCTIADLLALEPGVREQFLSVKLSYTESAGAPDLRQAIAGIYKGVKPEHVLVHSGAEEAILLFMQAALKPGDHIIVHYPCYQSLHEIARTMGVEVTHWEASSADWSLDVDAFTKLIKPNTKVVVVNTPHNPTGYLMPKDAFAALCGLCDKHGIILFSDEVYRESEYDAADRLPAACEVSGQFVSLGVMSKTYGLPGLRIGWVVTKNRAVLDRMATLKDYTTICNAAPSEFLSTLALKHRSALVQTTLAITAENLKLLDAFFTRHADMFAWTRPRAGTIAFPLLKTGKVDAFADTLVKQAGVLLLPASAYGYQSNHFRIGFGKKNFAAGLEAFEHYLRGTAKMKRVG